MSFIPDSEISDNELLYRAIHPSFWNYQEGRPTSALFKDKKGVSVDRDGMREENEIIKLLLMNRQNYGVGKLNAGETKNIGAYLKPNSLPENIYHALILESKEKIELSNSKARQLSKMMLVIKEP